VHDALVHTPTGVACRGCCELGTVLEAQLLGDGGHFHRFGAVLAVQQRADGLVQVGWTPLGRLSSKWKFRGK